MEQIVRRRARIFTILTSQRSGSGMLTRLLDSHPEIRCHGEVFLARNRSVESFAVYREALGPLLGSFPARPYAVNRFMNNLVDQGAYRATGFKLMYNHALRNPEVVGELLARRSFVIHLVRRDLLRTHVSAAVARRRRTYHADTAPVSLRIRLETDGLLDALQARRRRIEIARRLVRALPHVEVSYEELIVDQRRALWTCLERLGVDAGAPLETSTVKLTSDDLALVLENYEEVVSCLLTAGFEWTV